MSDGIPDDWYIEPSGESLILDRHKVAAELLRLRKIEANVILMADQMEALAASVGYLRERL